MKPTRKGAASKAATAANFSIFSMCVSKLRIGQPLYFETSASRRFGVLELKCQPNLILYLKPVKPPFYIFLKKH
jgi:hypothetical protein